MKVQKSFARWIPYIFTDDQKRVVVHTSKQSLKSFPKFNQRQIANIVTGDESWDYYFEQVRKIRNKI